MKAFNGWGGITKLKGKRRRPYWVRITVGWDVTPEGKAKQLYKTLGYYETRKDAMMALSSYHQNPIDLVNKDLTFKDVYEIWTVKHFEKYPSSKASMSPVFSKYCTPLHDMMMRDIRAVHMQQVIDSNAHLSLSMQLKIKGIFINNFKYCLENDILLKDYTKFVHTTNKEVQDDVKENFFSRSELDLIVKSNPDDMLLVLLHTGMRIGELINLKEQDINFSERYINVHGTKTKNADRIVPIHKDIADILKKQCTGGTYLFKNSVGNKVDYSKYTKKVFKPFMESLGLTQTPHATRHTFITLMDSAGVSSHSVTLKRIVGHSNSTVTHHYTHKEIDELVAAIDKLKILSETK